MIASSKRFALTSVMRFAWLLIYQGEAARAVCEKVEDSIEGEGGVVLGPLRMFTKLAERTVARGEALEAGVELAARRHDVNIGELLWPLSHA